MMEPIKLQDLRASDQTDLSIMSSKLKTGLSYVKEGSVLKNASSQSDVQVKAVIFTKVNATSVPLGSDFKMELVHLTTVAKMKYGF